MPASRSQPSEAGQPPRRKLPVGIRAFREVREGDCYYVDKTAFMRRLATEGRHYVLSRPRHFGKSLFLDTLKELFEGSEALFAGLDVHERWDWSVRHPVVRLDFGPARFAEPGDLEAHLVTRLAAAGQGMGLQIEHRPVHERLALLLEALHEHTGQRAVVLIDEYDKPILDAMGESDVARANRNRLRDLYAVIHSSDAHVEFSLLTGVTKFSGASLFSGPQGFEDITIDPRYSAVCGFTEAELEAVFAPELGELDRDAIRDWYLGYGWLGDEKVYNPFDILSVLSHRKFNAWWVDTKTPAALVRTLCRHRIASVALDGMPGNLDLLSSFDVDHVGTEALLFQSGYLTIKAGEDPGGGALPYRLGYPNRAVRQRLNEQMLRYLVKNSRRRMVNHVRLYRALEANDLPRLRKTFRRFFTSIPRGWYAHHDEAGYEGYCASVFYSYFAALGFQIVVEDATSRGRLDMAVLFQDNVYLFEFRVVELAGEGAATARLQGRGYVEKYLHLNLPIHLVAVEFSKAKRKVVAFEAATAGG